MPKLSEMLADEATISFEYRGRNYTVSYKPESVTSKLRIDLRKQVADGELNAEDLDAAFIAKVVTGWNVTDDNDEPLPVNFENACERSNGLQMTIVSSIYDDQRNPQNPPKGN